MRILLPILCALAIASCSSDRFYYPNGKLMASMQGNYKGLDLTIGKGLHLKAGEVDHSTPTLAGGQAFRMGSDSVGTTVVSGILAGGLPWSQATAAGSQIIPQIIKPAAPVVLQSKH